MELEITIHGNEVSFNVDCLYSEDFETEHVLNANHRVSTNIKGLTINNQLVSIPETIGVLTNLTDLNLDDNQLTRLPESIGTLNLEYLVINGNRLTRLPRSIGNIQTLQVLDLDDNELTSLPGSIGRLENLKQLRLQHNRITRIPGSIGNLLNLQTFDLGYNQLASIPEEIGRLRRLRRMNLINNPLVYLPATITRLPNLSIDLNNEFVLEPLKRQYIFESPNLLYNIKPFFNIREYNRLMNMETATRKYARASTRHYAKKNGTRKKYVDHINTFLNSPMQLEENPPSSKVFAKNAFVENIAGFLDDNKTTNEVLVRA